MKLCNKCSIELDNDNWSKNSQRFNKNTCNICICKYAKNRRSLTKEQTNKRKQIQRLKLKLETLLAYGNECINCKENHPLFLVLDHINNNGHFDRKDGYAGPDFNSYLKRLGYPGKDTSLKLLCHNCNAIKEYDARRSNTMVRKSEREVFIKQPYSISKEQDDALWAQAEELFSKLFK